MEKWIRDIVDSATRGLRGLIDATWERLTWVYRVIVEVFLDVRRAWNDVLARVRHYTKAVTRLASETFTTLWWLAWVRIPQVAAGVITDVLRWTSDRLNNLDSLIRTLVGNTIRWATDRLNELRAFGESVYRWAVRQINTITDTINRIAVLVYLLLTDPAHMAEWLRDAMISSLLRYVDNNFDRIFTYVRERSIHYTLRFAGQLEAILERLI